MNIDNGFGAAAIALDQSISTETPSFGLCRRTLPDIVSPAAAARSMHAGALKALEFDRIVDAVCGSRRRRWARRGWPAAPFTEAGASPRRWRHLEPHGSLGAGPGRAARPRLDSTIC